MHKRMLMIVALCASLLQVSAAEADYHVIPLPQQITMSKGKPFSLLPTTQIICTSSDELMQKNARFLCDYIKETTGLTLTVSNSAKVKHRQSCSCLTRKCREKRPTNSLSRLRKWSSADVLPLVSSMAFRRFANHCLS